MLKLRSRFFTYIVKGLVEREPHTPVTDTTFGKQIWPPLSKTSKVVHFLQFSYSTSENIAWRSWGVVKHIKKSAHFLKHLEYFKTISNRHRQHHADV